MYTPPQRNFDGRLQNMLDRLEQDPDSVVWQRRAHDNALRALNAMGSVLYDKVMDHFSIAWFERHTWRDQAEGYERLRQAFDRDAILDELILAFGEPDTTCPDEREEVVDAAAMQYELITA